MNTSTVQIKCDAESRRNGLGLLAAAVLAWSFSPLNLCAAVDFWQLGALPENTSTNQWNTYYASGISADGQVVAGFSPLSESEGRAVRWTRTGGIESLGTLGGTYSRVAGGGGMPGEAFPGSPCISADGSVIVGSSSLPGNSQSHAFRWTAATGMQDLGAPGGNYSNATAVTPDGKTVIGSANSTGFRWTVDGGMQSLGTLGREGSDPTAVSPDGKVVVGSSNPVGPFPTNYNKAYRWTNEGGMENLRTFLGDYYWSSANGVSTDGSVVVGTAISGVINVTLSDTAFRWTAATGLQKLIDGSSNAKFCSSDGSAVVGTHTVYDNGWFWRAYRWEDGQASDLFLPGDGYSDVSGISADGSLVWGSSQDRQYAHRAYIWQEGTGMIDVQAKLNELGGMPDGFRVHNIMTITAGGAALVSGVDANNVQQYGVIYGLVAGSSATVPEPTTLGLLATGVLGLMAKCRK